MTSSLGDVKINNKWYRVDIASYRDRDIVDFAPKAASPGGGIIHSELMLYQPLMQTDWRHGFGFQKFDDAAGYQKSVGNIDTRHEGIAMLYTAAVSSDTGTFQKRGGVTHAGVPYFWGDQGVRKFINGTWSTVTTSATIPTQLMFSLGTNIFASPVAARLRTSVQSGRFIDQPNELDGIDTYISENAPTTNYATAATLKVGTSPTTKHNVIYIKPSLAKLPVGATVTKAQLTMMCISRTTTVPTLKAARCLRSDVTEAGVTWNNRVGSTAWETAGASGASDRASATLFSGAMASTARQFFTMDLDLTEFATLVSANNGILIWEEYAGAEVQNAEFCSSSEANYDWRPYISVEYTVSGEWADAGVDTDSKDYNWAVVYNGYTYLGVRNTNHVHYSSSATLADLEGTTADTGIIYVGAGTNPTLGAIVFLSSLYIARADGLWQLGEDKIAKRVLDFSSETSDSNFGSLCIHNGYLTFAIRDVIYQWNGARLTRITPRRLGNNWPYLTYGSYGNFLTVGDFLYCTARTNEDTYTESLLCYDGVGWHKLSDLITDGRGKITMLFYDVSNDYLWYHLDGPTPVTYYIPFQSLSSYPYSSFPVTGTHSLYSAVHDMGFARVSKSSPSLLVEAYNLSATTSLRVYYSTDGGSWVEWGVIRTDGITELTFPGGLHTQEYKRIQLRVDFTTTTATESPILEGLTLRFLMRPDMAFGWNFNIVVADHFVYGEREDTRTAWQILKDIRIARNSKAPVEFVDIDGGTYYAYLTAFSRTAQERNEGEENEGVPSIESVINVNIVEAK